MKTFGENLKEEMKARKITQTKMAKILNISQVSVGYYIKGEREPSISTIRKICEILEVTPNELFGIYEWQFTEKREVKKEGDTFHINKMRDINIKK